MAADRKKKRRAGTENVPGIIGLGKAIEIAGRDINGHGEKLRELRDMLFNGLMDRIPHTRLNGHAELRLPGNINVCFRFIEGESLLLLLEEMGVCASSGSACSSGSLDPSHVLLAIGLPHEIAHGSLRLTIGESTTKEDIDYVLDILPKIVSRLRDMSPLYEEYLKKGE